MSDVQTSLVALLCRTADRAPESGLATEAFAIELGDLIGNHPRLIGSPGLSRDARFEDDLRTSRGCLLEAGGQIDDALTAGTRPVLVAGDCSIALTTLPTVARHRPEAYVLWLDAHADFNTPDTTASGYLGGMGLAGACGLWDAGLSSDPPFDPARVITCGVRDVEGGEQVALERSGVVRIEHPALLARAVAGREVFVHLDLDVLDAGVLPMQFPVSGGLLEDGLSDLLHDVATSCELIGAEITGLIDPDLAGLAASIVEPLALSVELLHHGGEW
jgi:arginase